MISRRRGGTRVIFGGALFANKKTDKHSFWTGKGKHVAVFGFGILLAFSATTLLAPKASAADARWKNQNEILYNNQSFIGPSTSSEGFRYQSTTAVNCLNATTGQLAPKYDYIEFAKNPVDAGNDASTGFYDDWSTYAASDSGIAGADNCDKKGQNTKITIANPELARKTKAQAQCIASDARDQDGCVRDAANTICSTYSGGEQARCYQTQTQAVPATGNPVATGSAEANATCPEGEAKDDNGDCAPTTDDDLCSVNSTEGLGWMICPVIDLLQNAIQKVDQLMVSILSINTSSSDFENGGGYHTAWNSFRVIATAILIIAGLVMLLSQAFGFEFMDAYTIRKTLPKLLIASVMISLSWVLILFAIRVVNVVSLDIRAIMLGPFQELPQQAVSFGSGSGITLTAALAIMIKAYTAGGVLAFLGTAMLALLIGFIIILVRNVVIMMLLIVAPIAIACYVLPNTEKVWKLWWTNFLGMLMVFPIISALIAAGHAFAIVSFQNENPITQLIGLVAYFLPYFVLPIAFRLATGVIGNIAGFVNDKNRGGFDRLRNFRGQRLAKQGERAKNGELFQGSRFMPGSTKLAAKTNSGLRRATTRGLGFTKQGRAAYAEKTNLLAAAHAKSEAGMGSAHNDEVLRAQTFESESAARQNMAREFNMKQADVEKAIVGARANGGFGSARQVYATRQLAATGTGYDDVHQVARTIARASRGNREQAGALGGDINSLTKQAGRADLALGAGKLIGYSENFMGSTARKYENGSLQGAERQAYISQTQALSEEADMLATKQVDPIAVLRGKGKNVVNTMSTLNRNIARDTTALQALEGERGSDQWNAVADRLKQNIGYAQQFDQNKSYGSIANQEEVTKYMQGHVDPGGDQSKNITGTRGYIDAAKDILTFQQPGTARRYEQKEESRQQADGSFAKVAVDDLRRPIYGSNQTQQQEALKHLHDIDNYSATRQIDPNGPNSPHSAPAQEDGS